jgi:glycosyltransferase involved in cell wall biosynthesis
MTETRRPWHVAFHSLACAVEADGQIRVQNLDGPMIEALADICDKLTIVAYDPPATPRDATELTDYVIDRSRRSIDVLSLGPMGTWREAPARTRRLAPVVSEASGSWDFLVLWLQNRRLRAVLEPSRCERVVVIDGTCLREEARTEQVPRRQKLLRMLIAAATERIGNHAVRRSGLVVVNSSQLAERYRRLNPNVVVHRWTRRRSEANHLIDDRFVGGKADLLMATRLTPYKGVFEGLEAFDRLRRELPDARLHVAGAGPSDRELRERVERLGLREAVTFHGWLSGADLFSLYARCDALLHLSYAEGFPRVVLEALAHSLPVVCTPVGGLTDMLEHEREVLYVEPRTVDPVVASVLRLASDASLRQTLIRSGFEAARESAVDEFARRVAGSMNATWMDLSESHRSTP